MYLLNLFYILIVILTALVSIAIGFRRGITGQVAPLLGFAFGAVVTRVLSPDFSHYFLWVERFSPAPEFNEFAVSLICSSTIYTVVYWLFACLNVIFKKALVVIEIGMFNRLLGAFFSMVKNLLWLSIFLNILICFKSESGLLRYERANYGNPVATVMEITPAILGCFGGEDFAHFHQLKEAKYISRNDLPENAEVAKDDFSFV